MARTNIRAPAASAPLQLTWEQTERIYRTLLELFADQYGLDINILEIRPAKEGEKPGIRWNVKGEAHGEHQETAPRGGRAVGR